MLAQGTQGDRSVDVIGDPRMRPNSSLGGRYRLEREIGRGGMAIVFLADDLKHHRRVALKILQPDVANAIGSKRFLQEIEIASGLAHPNVLPLYDSGESDGLLYYVMPYVDGETLRDRLVREKQLSLEDAISIIADVVDGVEYAHQHDIVHRDIKPENILLQGGRAVVADFGIARAVSRSAKQPLTSSGVILGTAQYMSPEQAMGEQGVGAQGAIHALAGLLEIATPGSDLDEERIVVRRDDSPAIGRCGVETDAEARG